MYKKRTNYVRDGLERCNNILRIIQERKSISQIDIGLLSGLNSGSTSVYVSTLLRIGKVKHTGKHRHGRGLFSPTENTSPVTREEYIANRKKWRPVQDSALPEQIQTPTPDYTEIEVQTGTVIGTFVADKMPNLKLTLAISNKQFRELATKHLENLIDEMGE